MPETQEVNVRNPLCEYAPVCVLPTRECTTAPSESVFAVRVSIEVLERAPTLKVCEQQI